MARSWNNRPDGGFIHAAYRNNAVSYFIGVHAIDIYPKSVISGDRHILTDGVTDGVSSRCISRLRPLWNLTVARAAWTNAVHGDRGNLAFMDGSVEETDTPLLKKAVRWHPAQEEATWNTHFMFP